MRNAFPRILKGILAANALLATGALLATPAMADNVAVTLGTGGLTADWTVPVASKLQTRLHFSYMKLDTDQESDDIDYTIEFDNVLLGVLLDWHPFNGGFRLSGGLAASDFGVDMEADSQDEYDVGDNKYVGALSLDGSLDFNSVAPYLGFGWGASVGETGLSFAADIGVLLIGEPTLSLDASGTASQIDPDTGEVGITLDVAANAEFQQDLEKERVKAEEDLDSISFYPVINLGVSYAF